jgi:endonuclease/exonuclease/phosphatase family metal-dependent hydrolase
VSPYGIVFDEIDHILVDGKFASSIFDVRSYHGMSCVADHVKINGGK